MNRYGQRAWSAALLLATLLAWFFALRGYYSNYYLVAASRGDKSVAEYGRLLERSVKYDRDNGRANSMLAAFHLRHNRFPEALRAQQQSMRSYRPVEAFEQLGNIQERVAQTSPDKRDLLQNASANYLRTVRMNPADVSAIERLMVQAYRRRDKQRLEKLAEDLARIDWENLNGVYLRALLEEAEGNYVRASALLQRLSAAGEPRAGALYRLEEVRRRLRKVQDRIGAHS